VGPWKVRASKIRRRVGKATFSCKIKVLQYMKIFVIDVDLQNITKSDLELKLKQSPHPCHFFVIHQGILEKMDERNPGDAKKFLKSVNCKWKIIDSGRGVQKDEIRKYDNVRFVEISALLKMLESFDKHALVQTLFAARNPIEQQEGVEK